MNDVLSTKERRAFGSMKLAYANFFPRRFQMKFLLLPALIFVGCQAAVAQTSECSTVPKASDRSGLLRQGHAANRGEKARSFQSFRTTEPSCRSV